jgi:hypothetical protein
MDTTYFVDRTHTGSVELTFNFSKNERDDPSNRDEDYLRRSLWENMCLPDSRKALDDH